MQKLLVGRFEEYPQAGAVAQGLNSCPALYDVLASMPDTGDIGDGSGHAWVKPVIPRIMIRFEIYRTQAVRAQKHSYSQRGSIAL